MRQAMEADTGDRLDGQRVAAVETRGQGCRNESLRVAKL